jgi:hypothetical protein
MASLLTMISPVGEKPVAKKSNKKSSTNKAKATPKPVVIDNTMDELHCELGNHKWQRAKQRGRKPFNCPLHQPEKVTVETTEKPKRASNKKSAKKNDTLFDAAKTTLNNPRCGDSDQRAIKYIIGQLADGNRKDATDHLVDRLNEIIRRVNR